MRSKFRKSKRSKKVIISACSLMLVAVVGVFCLYHSKILAGVFQSHKDESGNVTYTEKNTIRILEIVAQEGQQILGYSVEGYEPITKEQIESYTGTIDDLDDFKAATGYEVDGTPGNYKVKSSGNTAFGEDVLDGQMFTSGDSIVVDVVEAEDFTKENLDGVDLVYLNSADYNANLLYYYDQIVNGGSEGIQKGDYGRKYTGVYGMELNAREYSVETIVAAAGRSGKAEQLTADVFEKADVDNFKEYTLEEYKTQIASLAVGALDGDTTSDSIDKINEVIVNVNNSVKDSAVTSIKKLARSYNTAEEMTAEDRAAMEKYLKQGEFSGYVQINIDDYISKIVSSNAGSNKKIKSAISTTNKSNSKEALAELMEMNKQVVSGTDYSNISDEDRQTLEENIGKALYDTYTADYDTEKCIEGNLSLYADAFLNYMESLGDESTFKENLYNMIVKSTNESAKESAFETVADLPGNEDLRGELISDIDNADKIFSRMNFDEYKGYLINQYINELADLEDENALKSQQPDEETGEYKYQYDEHKIEYRLDLINNESYIVDRSCDMSWTSAMSLYDYITTGGAFMYNSELVSDLADFTNPNDENASNNVYKMLLVLRQLTPDYFNNTVRSGIDGDGNYTDSSGSSIKAWYAGTFCTNWNAESGIDYSKYREPAVVGALYDTNGNVIGNTSYINENILSYTGDSYFGGGSFWDQDYTGDSGIGKGDTNDTKKRLYVSWEAFKGKDTWDKEVKNGYLYIYYDYIDSSGNTQSKTEKITQKYTGANYTYYFDIPESATRFYVYILPPGWGDFNTTKYINVSDIEDGTLLYFTNAKADGNYKNVNGKNMGVINLNYELRKTSYPTYSSTQGGSDNYTKGEAICEIMNIVMNRLQSIPFKVLEIEPTGEVSDYTGYDGAVKLAQYLKAEIPEMNSSNYKEYFQVEAISIAEFNTRREELNGKYDLVYIGNNTGSLWSKEYKASNGDTVKRTVFSDGTNNDCYVMGEEYYMNGLVYYGIGPQRLVGASLRGTVATDYNVGTSSNSSWDKDEELWKEYFFAEFKTFASSNNNALSDSSRYVLKEDQVKSRYSGNDLTVSRMNDLLDYVKAGYPVLFAEGLLDCDDDEKYTDCYNKVISRGSSATYDEAVKWRYVDKNSKMYAFITQAKALGLDTNTNTYTTEKAAADGITDGYAYASLVSVEYATKGRNQIKLSSEEKFNGGLSYAVKRNEQADFTIISGPQEYDRDDSGNLISSGATGKYITDLNSCMFELEVGNIRSDALEWINENYEFHMYIDKSGTGTFPDNNTIELELASPYYDEKTGYIQIGTKNGKWPSGIEGFVAWKLEAVSKSNSGNEWEHIGYSAFASDTKDVYVLWVKPRDGVTCTLDFSRMIKNNTATIEQTGYKVYVDTIKYNNFVAEWSKEAEETYNASNSLLKVGKLKNIVKNYGGADECWSVADANGKEYDMIVFGFCDSYAGLDMSSISCLKNIDYFVNTAQKSMLFSHDNASYMTTFNAYSKSKYATSFGNKSYTQDFARYTTSYIRGLLGMDVYGSSYSQLAFDEDLADENQNNVPSLLSWLYEYTPSVANARKYIVDDVVNPTEDELSDMRGYVNGQLMWYSTTTSDLPYHQDNGTSSTAYGVNNYVGTTKAELVNKGQISTYPFYIGDNISTAQTHFQYTRLDVEDDDVIVWYTLSAPDGTTGNDKIYNIEKGDGSNNYYIYSKGNITYTGAGHAKISDTSIENKLFINTVIAAIKVGDFAPDVTFPDAATVNGKEVLYAYDTEDKLTVTYKATDYGYIQGERNTDEKKIFNDIRIFLDKDGDGEYDPNEDVILNGQGSTYLKDSEGNVMTIDANSVINRTNMTFYLSYEDIKNLYLQNVASWETNLSESEYVSKLFEKYSIGVSVLSESEVESYNVDRDEDESISIESYWHGASAGVRMRSLFDLD